MDTGSQSQDGGQVATASESAIALLLREMAQGREQRERELAEERRQRDEERRLREEQLHLEMARLQETAARREEESQRQLDVLRSLVSELHEQGEAAVRRAERDRDVKVTKLTTEDDIEAYLTTFERLMTAHEIPEARWAYKLAPQLVGKAQQAYSAMSAGDAGDYSKVKAAVLRRYDINAESYRERFRTMSKKDGETNRELVARLEDLATKWLQDCTSMAEIRDEVIKEQLLNSLPERIRIWVKERKPKTSLEAGQLADDFVQARKPLEDGDKKHPKRIQCLKCKKFGHAAKDCRSTARTGDDEQTLTAAKTTGKPRRDLQQVECFNCHQKGHYSSNCPSKACYCNEGRFDHTGGPVAVTRRRANVRAGVPRCGTVEGNAVTDILLDTGCDRTLVHRDLVPEGNLLPGEGVTIRCAHGDTVLYPLARVRVQLDGRDLTVEAAVSSTVPASVLLGTDVPELMELLGTGRQESEIETSTAGKLAPEHAAMAAAARSPPQRPEPDNRQ